MATSHKLWALLFAISLLAPAGQSLNQQNSQPIILNVIATDRSGEPIKDLTPDDLTLTDNGASQQIDSLALSKEVNPTPFVVLFDLIDLSLSVRYTVAQSLKQALAEVPGTTPVSVYFVLPNGQLHSVIGPTSDLATSATRSQRIGPFLDQTLQRITQPRTTDMNVTPVRFNALYEDLQQLNNNLSPLAGRKQVLWITYGIPSDIHFATGWKDLSPVLRDLAAQFNANHVSIYTLDPGMAVGTLNRNGLGILSAGTGGRAFAAIDVLKAFAQARTDNAATYALTYDAQAVTNGSDKVHEVRLKCKRKNVLLFSQQLYVGALR